MTDKLKNCPFCCGEAETEWHHGYWGVRCKSCYAEVTADGMNDAIEAWNIRKPMDRIVEEVNEIGRRVCNNVKCNHECVEDSERICDHGALMGAVIDAIVKGVQNE